MRAEVRMSIAPNPSHLEAVAPVVLGLVRAEQASFGTTEQMLRMMGPFVLPVRLQCCWPLVHQFRISCTMS